MGNDLAAIREAARGEEWSYDIFALCDEVERLRAQVAKMQVPESDLEIVNGWLVLRGAHELEYPAGAAYGAMPYSDSEPMFHLSELPGWDRDDLAAENERLRAVVAEVEKLARLLDRGLITHKEYVDVLANKRRAGGGV